MRRCFHSASQASAGTSSINFASINMEIGMLHNAVNSRVAALKSLAILDTPPEAAYDAITRLAALVCGTPIALISLIDGDRLWFKSAYGLEVSGTTSASSFCCEAANVNQVLEVCDARVDRRFCGIGLVTGNLQIRYYAGIPLEVNGATIGTLCVLGQQPHQLTAVQTAALKDLSLLSTTLLRSRIEAFTLLSLARAQ